MMIIGCDFHTRYQQIAMAEESTGEYSSSGGSITKTAKRRPSTAVCQLRCAGASRPPVPRIGSRVCLRISATNCGLAIPRRFAPVASYRRWVCQNRENI